MKQFCFPKVCFQRWVATGTICDRAVLWVLDAFSFFFLFFVFCLHKVLNGDTLLRLFGTVWSKHLWYIFLWLDSILLEHCWEIKMRLHSRVFNLLHVFGNFSWFCVCRLLVFFSIKYFKISFRNTIGVSSSLDPDQDRQHMLSVLVWFQVVCKGYTQTTLVCKRMKNKSSSFNFAL